MGGGGTLSGPDPKTSLSESCAECHANFGFGDGISGCSPVGLHYFFKKRLDPIVGNIKANI